MIFRVEGFKCLLTLRKKVMSSFLESKVQAVQMFLTLKIKARLFFATCVTNYPKTELNILEEFRRTESSTTSLWEFNLYKNFPSPLYFIFYNSVKKNPPFGPKFDSLKPVRLSLSLVFYKKYFATDNLSSSSSDNQYLFFRFFI
jgi:hypothetical protein